jgi:hypothetical protein
MIEDEVNYQIDIYRFAAASDIIRIIAAYVHGGIYLMLYDLWVEKSKGSYLNFSESALI